MIQCCCQWLYEIHMQSALIGHTSFHFHVFPHIFNFNRITIRNESNVFNEPYLTEHSGVHTHYIHNGTCVIMHYQSYAHDDSIEHIILLVISFE